MVDSGDDSDELECHRESLDSITNSRADLPSRDLFFLRTSSSQAFVSCSILYSSAFVPTRRAYPACTAQKVVGSSSSSS